MADKRRLTRWILAQNYSEEFLSEYPDIEILMFDEDDYLYWIDPLTDSEVKARLNEPISGGDIAIVGAGFIGDCYIQ